MVKLSASHLFFMPEKEEPNVIGIKVTKNPHPDTELSFESAPIPPEVLAEMIRCFLRPILDMEEIQRRQRNYALIKGFAATPNIAQKR